MTLSGHKEAVSCCAWTDKTEIITASWDHSVKIWDVELGGVSRQLDSSKAFTSLSYSPLNRTLITGSSDRLIRLYDPRSHGKYFIFINWIKIIFLKIAWLLIGGFTEGSVVKLGFLSHSGWVSSVAWSPNNEHLFISGSYDRSMKMWDTRRYNFVSIYSLLIFELNLNLSCMLLQSKSFPIRYGRTLW